jgi:F-type H+-transporting ATPase subunit c
MKALKLAVLAAVVFLVAVAPVMAQPAHPPEGTAVSTVTPPGLYVLAGASVGAGVGAGITILGAGYGFSRIGSAALESMARQPEVAGRVQTAMLIIAALLEGATFFALIVCILVAQKPSL